mmetsp:Transcript_77989/g.223491  ORF Transcript_77989/g.223491 Transcript_77989/m.223491 type:complete len:228 (-) Transcript_77989:401-1084(-)
MQLMPTTNTSTLAFRTSGMCCSATSSEGLSVLGMLHVRSCNQSPNNGTTQAAKEGKKSHLMVAPTEMLPASHSIVVVTSPTGLHAPPALAAMTTMPPMVWRTCLSLAAVCRRSLRTTIVAVKLSMTALRKKQNKLSMGISNSWRPPVDVMMKRVTTENPPKWSMDSTTAIAGSKNKMSLPTSSKLLSISACISSFPCSESCGWKPAAKKVHIAAEAISITAALFTPT